MKTPICALLILLATMDTAAALPRPSTLVDPFIGTGGHGHTYPGATLPFGMVQLSPDTRLTGWDGCSGYHDSDRVVYGFSHTHLSGTGVSDYGDLLFMPSTGRPRWENGSERGVDHGYGSRFDKADERASAGFYHLHLTDTDIDVDLTVTPRVGIHRYTFPKHALAHVLIDLAHRDEVLDASLRIVDEYEIEGHRRSRAWAQDQVVHFVARFSKPILRSRLRIDGEPSGARQATGRDLRAALFFGDEGGPLLVRVGVSAVDVEGARRNLESEAPHQDFDVYREQAAGVWDAALSRIRIEGASWEQQRVFFTALYHSMIAPNTFSDVDGRYRGMDHQVHQLDDDTQYTVFSLWDTFRATHPLFTLLEPDRVQSFVRTFLRQYEQGGRLPVWELAANETDCMIGYHSVSVIADAYLKGLRDFDADLALRAMIASAMQSEFGIDDYRRQGYLAADRESESVSKTLEYAYDDWCIARMAEAMGESTTATKFYERSQAWRHLLDPTSLQMRPRSNGRWLSPFDPRRVDFNYTEANAWQYRFFVPHDIASLAAAMGGDAPFEAKLDSLFTAPTQTTGRTQADITGLIGQYAHGNEPSHHMAWLYHYVGRPQKSARRVRQILDTLYSDQPDGLSGNEDCGQMSSWYVLSALGLYPVAPGSGEYALLPPHFRQVEMELPSGAVFRSRRQGHGDHVGDVLRNGRVLDRSYLTHGEIAKGVDLVFRMSERPGTWGQAVAARPHSRVPGPIVLAAPTTKAPADRFRDSMRVELEGPEGADLFYRLASDREWQRYDRALELTETTDLEFRARADQRYSPGVRSHFHRIAHDWQVRLACTPNSQYTAGGPSALVDGLRGSKDWRTGNWVGVQGQDFVAIVDLGHPTELTRVGGSFLQDARSWIWMPTELVVEISTDDQHFEVLTTVTHGVADDVDEVVLAELAQQIPPREARYVRFTARNYGRIPAWHPGAGGEAFVFVDELVVETTDDTTKSGGAR